MSAGAQGTGPAHASDPRARPPALQGASLLGGRRPSRGGHVPRVPGTHADSPGRGTEAGGAMGPRVTHGGEGHRGQRAGWPGHGRASGDLEAERGAGLEARGRRAVEPREGAAERAGHPRVPPSPYFPSVTLTTRGALCGRSRTAFALCIWLIPRGTTTPRCAVSWPVSEFLLFEGCVVLHPRDLPGFTCPLGRRRTLGLFPPRGCRGRCGYRCGVAGLLVTLGFISWETTLFLWGSFSVTS